MSDETREPVQPESPGSAPSEASAAWRAVVAELDALGEAIGRWAKAAVNDPENKRRLDELSTRLEGLVDGVATTVKGAADGQVGESFKEAAEKTGEAFKVAGGKISEEVGPKLASAFIVMGDKLRGAADKMEERAARESEPDSADQPASLEKPNEPGPSA